MSNDIEILNQIQDVDLSTVETDFPLLASGIVALTVESLEWKTEESKKEPGKTNVYLECKFNLAQPHRTADRPGIPAKVVNPGDRGSKIIERIYVGKYIDEKDDNKEKWYGLDRIAKLREAAYGKAATNTKFTDDQRLAMFGQTVQAQLLFEPAPVRSDTKEVMGPRTVIKTFIRKAT